MTQRDRAVNAVHRLLDRGVTRRGALLAGLTAAHRPYLDYALAQFADGVPPFEGSTEWGERDSYRAIHLRLRKERGRASEQTCPCGEPAANWSYDGGDPDERYGVVKTGRPAKRRYSIHLDQYTARCYSCHARLDRSGGRG